MRKSAEDLRAFDKTECEADQGRREGMQGGHGLELGALYGLNLTHLCNAGRFR